MTTPLDPSRAHAEAFAAMIRGRTATEGYQLFVARVTVPDDQLTYPYYVVWPPPVARSINTQAGYDGHVTSTIQLTAVGRTEAEVLAALDRAAAGVHRRRPVIEGRRCSLITQVGQGSPPSPDRDDTVRTSDGQPVFFSFLQFAFMSTPVRPEGTV